MTTALLVLAALLTLLQLWDGWTTYQILKLGGVEKNPVVSEVMDTLGTYPTLVLLKTAAAAIAWALAMAEGYVEVRVAGMVLLAFIYIWVAVGNWQALRRQKAIKETCRGGQT